ncbi:MAG: TonB-dependent receptor [Vicinamibacterales bacterium]
MARALFSILCVLLMTSLAEAATVSGVVVDTSGAPVAGASVMAGSITVTSAIDGRFTIENAPDGEVLVQAMATGFAIVTVRVTGPTTDLRLTLQPAPLVTAVVVTASRGAERLSTASSTTVVSSAEILTSGGGALDDVLRNTPGFSLFRRSSSRISNPTTQGVTLRGVSGSGASRTLVLADGLPLNDAFGSWVYWNRIPQAAIDRVEIVRGTTGDLYGADALGGVVQVLTFAPDRRRARLSADGGTQGTARFSGFASEQRGPWSGLGAIEWLRTDGAVTVGEEVRGPIDVAFDSDYATGFIGAGYKANLWHGAFRASFYDEERANGTPLQVNDTNWKQISGDLGGGLGPGVWTARIAAGTQTYYQTFTAVAADRRTERLTTTQNTPSDFATYSGQWAGAIRQTALLVGAEGRRTESEVSELRYSVAGVETGPFLAGGVETNSALFGRVTFAPYDNLTVALGGRADFWRSTPDDAALAKHSANFFSPRVSAELKMSEQSTVHASFYRGYRTPTLNELHRGFRVGTVVTNPNPELDPEKLTGVEAGVLLTNGELSARVTGFWNQLDDAVTNVTVAVTAAQTTRQRQNTDTVRATGIEFEADYRGFQRWTLSGLVGATRSTFSKAPAQPALQGNRVPQVPIFQLGGSLTYLDPHGFTGSVQGRVFGSQYEDDLNAFKLRGYGVIDLSASQQVTRGVNVFMAVENLFDSDYDTGRTPRNGLADLRTIGFPRSFRAGVRVFLP